MLTIHYRKNTKIFSKDTFKYKKHNSVWHHDHRDQSVLNLIQEAVNLIDKDVLANLKEFSVTLDTSDHGHFSHHTYSDAAIADFNFDKWVEVGNYDYHDITQKMLERSSLPPSMHQLFWMGSYDCHWSRRKLGEMTKHDDRIAIVNVDNWHWDDKIKRAVTNNGKYTSMIDHCEYKYLIDFQGHGYSGRTKYLLHSGRPLFYVERDCNEYWYFSMKPMEHFIPIKRDLSDFYERFEWVENNYDEALKIADNARTFAMNNLKRSDAVERYRKQILKWGGLNV